MSEAMVTRRNLSSIRTHAGVDGRRTGTGTATRANKPLWAPIGEYFMKNPAALVAAAFAGGIILGWLVKRR